MHRYLARRLLIAIPTLLLVSLVVFSLIRLIPGDVVVAKVQDMGVLGKGDEQKIRHQLGLDRSFTTQYFDWLGGVFRGDMGKSLWTGEDVFSEVRRTLPVSAELALFAVAIGLVVAIPAGILSAVRQDTLPDYLSRLFAIVGLSVPNFLLATLALLYLSIWFGWTPPVVYKSLTGDTRSNLTQYALPSVILGLSLCATTMRMTRSAMLEVLRQDYIRTAWSKGLRERVVVTRHALKNAAIPVITIVGSQLGAILGGAIIIETIFGLPGMGSLTLDAIVHRDYTQIQASILVVAAIMISMNLLVDLCYAWFDPRIHYT